MRKRANSSKYDWTKLSNHPPHFNLVIHFGGTMALGGDQSGVFTIEHPLVQSVVMKTTGIHGRMDEKGALNGRWTKEEHELFLEGLGKYGREWKKVACLIKTRSAAQVPIWCFFL
jgi:hypothetical protein